jgi:hypothetical protein
MEKNLDQWNEIADLINKDKKIALDDFHCHEFVQGDQPVRESMPLFCRRPVMRLMISAVAASMLLVAGLIFFWMFYGSRHSVSSAPTFEQLLDGSFLYNIGSEPKAEAPEPRADSFFFPQFSAWGEAAGLNHTTPLVAKPVDSSLPIEHGDPVDVHRKMIKVIREKSIERMLTQFCQICKEV